MKIQVVVSLLSVALLAACSTTAPVTTERRPTLEQKLNAKYAGTDMRTQQPAPPAEGPEDTPQTSPNDVHNNPILMPTPLLRYWASSRTP
jgi:hypothetical protein